MDRKAFELLKALSSETRIRVIDELIKGREHPEEIARHLGIKRQSVDRHLLILHDMGIVERSAVFPPEGRPKIVYRLSGAGKSLIRDFEEVAKRHGQRLLEMYRSEKRVLDMALAESEISEEVYLEKLSSLKKKFGL